MKQLDDYNSQLSSENLPAEHKVAVPTRLLLMGLAAWSEYKGALKIPLERAGKIRPNTIIPFSAC